MSHAREGSGPEVEVLLATYNGERFLEEQIDSLLAQSYAPLRILARDDGSRDRTPAMLARYAADAPERFRLLPTGTPAGSAKGNFARLLEASTAPYVALSDQDDVWLPDKISRSMARMRELEAASPPGTPLLVFTDLLIVDEALEPLHSSFWAHQGIDPRGIHRFPRTLAQNTVTGCTALLNCPLARLAARIPEGVFMHDWWIALLASAFGAASFLPEATVLYRQHGGNVVGAAEHPRVTGVPKWRQHELRRAQWEQGLHQAEALWSLHGAALPPRPRQQLAAYLRAEHHPNRLVRVASILQHRAFLKGLRANLAILWYLWDMQAAKKNG